MALTLREVCGLTTEEIAQAFLSARADAGAAHRARQGEDPRRRIPYQVPAPDELPERLDSVLRVIYLVFNEGYSASSGASLTRRRPVRARRSAWGGCWSNCCRSPRRSGCWR